MATKGRILLFTSYREVAALFLCLFSGHGYQIELVESEHLHLEKSTGDSREVFLMDGAMPSDKSFSLIKKIRHGGFGRAFENAPVVLFDSHPMDHRKAELAFVNGYYPFPFTVERILEGVKTLVGDSQIEERPTRSFLLERQCVPMLFSWAHQFKLSGTFRFTRQDITREAFLDQGMISGARSTLSSDRFGNVLIAAGRISENQLNEALISSEKNKRMIGQELIERGLIKPEDLDHFLSEQFSDILESIFHWDKYEFSYVLDQEQTEAERPSLHPFRVIYGGMKGGFDNRSLDQIVTLNGEYLIPNLDSSFRLGQMPLSDDEIGIIRKLDGLRTVSEIVQDSGMEKESARVLLAALLASALLRLSKEPATQPILLEEQKGQDEIRAAFDESFFENAPVILGNNEPPPITSEQLKKEFREVEPEKYSWKTFGRDPQTGKRSFKTFVSDFKEWSVGKEDSLRFLVLAFFLLLFFSIAISMYSIYSKPVPKIKGASIIDTNELKMSPKFTAGLDMYINGIEKMKSDNIEDVKEAIAMFEQALFVNPQSAETKEALADAKAKLAKLESGAQDGSIGGAIGAPMKVDSAAILEEEAVMTEIEEKLAADKPAVPEVAPAAPVAAAPSAPDKTEAKTDEAAEKVTDTPATGQ